MTEHYSITPKKVAILVLFMIGYLFISELVNAYIIEWPGTLRSIASFTYGMLIAMWILWMYED